MAKIEDVSVEDNEGSVLRSVGRSAGRLKSLVQQDLSKSTFDCR